MEMKGGETVRQGGCLCGAVRYEVRGPMRGVVNCHCDMCRRLHGAFGAYTKVENSDLSLVEEAGLAWYASSDKARRGFCRACGASLFWQPSGAQTTSIAAGTLDSPSGLVTIGHIFTAEKGDFYDIADDLKQFPGSADGKMDTTGA
jgi:hypothetical protein